tara:strand:- start:274 stop:2547 length:2274 start_codon:yes stop_codon:yes gene_type:complete
MKNNKLFLINKDLKKINKNLLVLIEQLEFKNYSKNKIDFWIDKIIILNDAGYGNTVVSSFIKNSILILNNFEFKFLQKLADLVSIISIKSNKQSAILISEVTPLFLEDKNSQDIYEKFLELIDIFTKESPDIIESFLKNLKFLKKKMDIEQIFNWSMTGIKIDMLDKERRLSYFKLESKESKIWIERIKNNEIFTKYKRRIEIFNKALWNLKTTIKELESDLNSQNQRPSFLNEIIFFPSNFENKNITKKSDYFFAVSAHISSHLNFSNMKFSIKNIKPIQIAIISLIEDARIEALAINKYPGLRDVWLPYHKFKEDELSGINLMLASLSRSLIDHEYNDENVWVSKGKKLFYDAKKSWENPLTSIEIGNKLSNDIGQMRIQFNFKSYIVSPIYRDDNLGLWNFPTEKNQDENIVQEQLLLDTFKEKNEYDKNSKNINEEKKKKKKEKKKKYHFQELKKVLVSEESEYDYLSKINREKWTKIYEFNSGLKKTDKFDQILKKHNDTILKISSLIKKAKNNSRYKKKNNYEGDFLNIDACIENTISAKTGGEINGKIYDQIGKNPLDSSLMILLDISKSTEKVIPELNKKIIDLEFDACSILSHSLQLNDQKFAISAFCSNTKDEIRYFKIKNFDEKYSKITEEKLANLKSKYSTRLGAAIRYSYKELEKVFSHRKLLIVLSDGEPSDIDVKDKNYLVEDAKKSVTIAKSKSIDVFCFGMEDKNSPYLNRIFGKKNSIRIENLNNLHHKIAKIYFKLTI